MDTAAKNHLHRYLRSAREDVLWKLDGLSEYDARRPLTSTGTNLLGLVKHLASIELGYLGDTFERPHGIDLPWFAEDADPNADMWATAQESRDDIIGLYHAAWRHGDATIEALDLDSTGTVAHWPPDRSTVTLHQILIHLIAETYRHAGHADILRESIDAAVGMREGNENIPGVDQAWWGTYRDRLEAAAKQASAHAG